MLSAFFKLIVLVIVVLILLQLEYNGRKLQTYVVEYVKSLKGQKETVYIQEEPGKKAEQEKQTVMEKKVVAPDKKPIEKKAVEKKAVKQAPKKESGANKVMGKKPDKQSPAEPKKIKIIKQKADDQPEVTEEDRKELQQILQ